MKFTFSCLFVLIATLANAQQHTLTKLWETDTILRTPESALFYKKGGYLFQSNCSLKPAENVGKGSIGKVSLDGKVINVDWVTGLTAPKGLGVYKNFLYAADLKEVVIINIKEAKIEKRIPVEGATFLNDIAIDKNGVVYVSDTRTFKVHKIENGVVTTFLDKLKAPNGLYCYKDTVYVLDKGSLLKIDANKNITVIADGMDGSTDGLEKVKDGEFLVTSWSGIAYYVKADGSKEILFDNRVQKINSADIGYNKATRTVYVPTFYGNKIVAYHLN